MTALCPFRGIIGRVARRRRACRTKPVPLWGVVYTVHTTPRFSSNHPLPASKPSDRQRFWLSARCRVQLFRCFYRLVAVFVGHIRGLSVKGRRIHPDGFCCGRTYIRALAFFLGLPLPV